MSSAITIAAVATAAVAIGSAAYQMSQGGSQGGGMLPETSQGQAAGKMAIDQYNTYLTDFKPTEQKFIADAMKPTAIDEAKQIGKANADIAQKTAVAPGDPNRILNDPTKVAGVAAYQGAVDNNVVQAVQNNQIAKEGAISDIGLGRKNTAQLSMDNLAKDAQGEAISQAQANAQSKGQVTNAIGSAIGAVGGIAKNWPTTPTIAGYDPYTDYSGAGAPGPYAPVDSGVVYPVEGVA